MSKAEERYLEYFQDGRVRNCNSKEAFLLGYHQAEQDNALTWEDMMIIHKCIKDAMNLHMYKMMEGLDSQKIVYEEVLKKFNKESKQQ